MLSARSRAFSTAGLPRDATQNVTIGSRMQNDHNPTVAARARVCTGLWGLSGWRSQLTIVRMASTANAIAMASERIKKGSTICGRIAYTTIFQGQLARDFGGLPDKAPAALREAGSVPVVRALGA